MGWQGYQPCLIFTKTCFSTSLYGTTGHSFNRKSLFQDQDNVMCFFSFCGGDSSPKQCWGPESAFQCRGLGTWYCSTLMWLCASRPGDLVLLNTDVVMCLQDLFLSLIFTFLCFLSLISCSPTSKPRRQSRKTRSDTKCVSSLLGDSHVCHYLSGLALSTW